MSGSTSSTLTRTWSQLSRSRTVTVWSSSERWSTVTAKGTPSSRCARSASHGDAGCVQFGGDTVGGELAGDLTRQLVHPCVAEEREDGALDGCDEGENLNTVFCSSSGRT